MIQFSCPACGKQYQVSDDAAGRSAKCKRCGEILRVPGKQIGEPEFLSEPPRFETNSGSTGMSEKEKVVTIQQTSKAYKLGMTIGVLIMIVASIPGFLAGVAGCEWVLMLCLNLGLLGGTIYCVSRFLAWWNNG
jgi:predicted Zn finger-like uncharacterized protein